MRFERKLRAACLTLAQELNWQKETQTEAEHLALVTQIADRFVLIAEKLYCFVDSFENSEAILIGAINYIRGQVVSTTPDLYLWFEDTLAALLRICSPEMPISLEDIPFLVSLQKSIIVAIQDALNKNSQLRAANGNSQQKKKKSIDN